MNEFEDPKLSYERDYLNVLVNQYIEWQKQLVLELSEGIS